MAPNPDKKPLLESAIARSGLSGYALAKLSGLDDVHVHRARYSNLRAEGAGRIAAALAQKLSLSEREALLLKAEIMGRPGAIARAHFGGIDAVVRGFGVNRTVAGQILDPAGTVNGNNAERIRERLSRGDVPDCVARDVLSRIGPSPTGRVTHRARGQEAARARETAARSLEASKPLTHRALGESGLSRRGLRERAGVGRETLRNALYDSGTGRTGEASARRIASALRDAAGLSEAEAEGIFRELLG